MQNNIQSIRQKINVIQVGLLRYHGKKKSLTMHVLVKALDETTLVCAVTSGERPDLKKLVNKRVNMIQKSENDYLYLSGVVLEKAGANKRTLYMHIVKACWFVRRSKGTLSWLQEKHVYETNQADEQRLVS